MYLKRDRLKIKQIVENKRKGVCPPPTENLLRKLSRNAFQEISLPKIKNQEVDYSRIELFLLLASPAHRCTFYEKLIESLKTMFANQQLLVARPRRLPLPLSQLFNKIVKDYFENNNQTIKPLLAELFSKIIIKLLTTENTNHLEEKFIEPLLIYLLCYNLSLQCLGSQKCQQIKKLSGNLVLTMGQDDKPKNYSNHHFLRYCIFRLFEHKLPHEKYLYNQLLRVPNPRKLLPFCRTGTFVTLTNEILLKSNKINISGLKYWSYYNYEECDIYEQIRKAADWSPKIEMLVSIIMRKMRHGLQRYLNVLSEKTVLLNNDSLNDQSINNLTSYVEICLQICINHSLEETLFETALERIDIGHAFQNREFMQDQRLKQFMSKLVELYLVLLQYCSKKHLKIKFLRYVAINIVKLMDLHREDKYATELTMLVCKYLPRLAKKELSEFFYAIINSVNRGWQSNQQCLVNNDIARINPLVVSFLAEIVDRFGFEDDGVSELKVLKMEFFYILALNYKQSDYFESKKKFSKATVDINSCLGNNSILNSLHTRPAAHQAFRAHLRSLFNDYDLSKIQNQGVLAVIDQIISYRIQVTKELATQQGKFVPCSFYSLLVDFLQQVEKYDPTGQMLPVVQDYLLKCKKAYLIEIIRMKFKDESKSLARDVIVTDMACLIEGCASANPIVAQFCLVIIEEYISIIPELAIYTKILLVFAECISALYHRMNKQFQPKAESLRSKHFQSSTLLPTNTAQVQNRLINLMQCLYSIVLRGHCIDDDYLRIRVQYLIREHCKSTNFTFGWKYLKHLINNFKDDKEFISKEILANNSCSWLINELYFGERIKKLKAEKILLDSSLFPIHNGECQTRDIKKIFLAVQPEVQTEFLAIPSQYENNPIDQIIKQIDLICLTMDDLQLEISPISNNNPKELQQRLQDMQSTICDIMSRVKMIYINKLNQSDILGKIFQICKKYTNWKLFKHVLFKIIPFFECINEYSTTIYRFAAETMHFVVKQLNMCCKLSLGNPNYTQNTFDIKLNCFDQVRVFQQHEINKTTSNSSYYDMNNRRYIVINNYERRMFNLKKMYNEVLKFLTLRMHVCIAKSFPLTLVVQIFSVNFLIEKEVLELLPLETICYCLNSQLELVNVLKSAIEKGETMFDESLIDDFYFKTLKLGLYHFQKNKTFYTQQLLTKSYNTKSLKKRINFFIQICDYLRNEDFHRISKKKLPRRNQIFPKKSNSPPLNQLLDNNYPQRSLIASDILFETQQQLRSTRIGLNTTNDITVMRYCLLYLISEQIDCTKAYAYAELSQINNPYSLSGKKKFINNQQILNLMGCLGTRTSLTLVYNLVHIFGNRLEDPSLLIDLLMARVNDTPAYHFPEFLDLYIQSCLGDQKKLKEINYWKLPHIQIILKYLDKKYELYPYLQVFVTKVLSRLEADQILFYLPQIFQALTLTTGRIIYDFLLQYAHKSAVFAHQLIWIAKVQSKQEQEAHGRTPRLPGVEQHLQQMQRMARSIVKNSIRQFTRQEKSFFRQVNDFYESITAISGKMLPKMTSNEKKQIIQREVEMIRIPKSVYLPINPIFKVINISKDSGMAMQSAAKCPFLLTFLCTKYCGPDIDFNNRKQRLRMIAKQCQQLDFARQFLEQQTFQKRIPTFELVGNRISKIAAQQDSQLHFNLSLPQQAHQQLKMDQIHFSVDTSSRKDATEQIVEISCIFKVFDDIRQDCLALQIIKLFREIFMRHQLDLKLFPYKTVSNRTGASLDIGGIIEVVPKTVSRDSIGKTNQETLYEFFLNNFGKQYNPNFQQAQQNFIRSQAGYSIVCYILQVKDRHNGNILIDKEEGYLIHIDFGFIFDISPGRNMRFERADFKLTDEMVDIMGGSIDSEPFHLYLNLVIKGFLIARKYHQHVINVVRQMYRSGLPCFLENSMQNLEARFVLEMNEIEAAEQMRKTVLNAADHWTTNWYDRIQWMQQKIHH